MKRKNNILYLALCLFLFSCSSIPKNTADGCSIFSERYLWYKHAKNTEKKWGTPIYLQLAIIKMESDFDWLAKPKRNKIGHNFSKIKLKKKLGNNIITCLREPQLDPWGRTVAECFLDDESISSYMVKNGYACDYKKYSKKKYAKQQEYAKSRKLGIWALNFENSWEKKCG